MSKRITVPSYQSLHEAIHDGSLIQLEDHDTFHARLRAVRAFHFEPLDSMYSAGQIIPFTAVETSSGREYREAEERRRFSELIADLTKCGVCGTYDCTQHTSTPAKQRNNEAKEQS